jgi:hypothetical protein
MSHMLCSRRDAWIVQCPVGRVRLFLVLLLLLCGSWASAADPPAKEKGDPKETLVLLRAYLPAIRCKALLEDERQSVADFKKLLQLSQAFVEGGFANQIQAQQVEEELLRSRLRLLRRETDYHDSRDQLTQRTQISAERRQEMENAAILPLENLFRRYEKLSSDFEEAVNAASCLGRDEDVAKVRLALIKLLTTSALVKETTLPKRFREQWREWKKIKSIEVVSKKLQETKRRLVDLHRAGGKLEKGKNEPEFLPPPRLPGGDTDKKNGRDQQPEKSEDSTRKDYWSEKELYFVSDVGSLEYHLRDYEAKTWKVGNDSPTQLVMRNEQFRRILLSFKAVIGAAYQERVERLGRSWPSLFPARLKEVDLIASEDGTAEETVTRMLKTPDAQLNGKKKLRRVRTLAKSYPLEQRLFVLAYMRRAHIRDSWRIPKPPPDPASNELIGPVAARPYVPPFDAAQVIGAYRTLSQARQRLLQTWIDYQMVRLDLYNNLGVSPPAP